MGKVVVSYKCLPSVVATYKGKNNIIVNQSKNTPLINIYTAKGDTGPKGQDGSPILNLTAGEIINGDSVVMVKDGKAYKNDPNDTGNIYLCIGLAKNAAGVGEDVKVTLCGEHISAGWGLIPNQIYYAGSNGGITLTPPDNNLSQVVGFAKDADTMIVEIGEPFIMAN